MELFKKQLFIILYWIAIYFYPAGQFVLLVGFFIIADTITGLVAANKRGEAITSKRGSDVIRKFLVYGCGVIVAHVIQREFVSDFPCMKIISGLIAFNELKSIDENIKSISGFSLFEFFIKKLKQ